MRVRLFCLGEPWVGQILWLDSFPVTLSEDVEGLLHTGSAGIGNPLCVLDEQHGNLVFCRHDPPIAASVNSDPLEQGGLAPGDVLTVGDRQFLISYERTTSHPLPRRKYQIAATASP
jgi:hypothetical protein